MKLPVISGRDCVAALGRAGFDFVRQKGSHVILRRDDPFAEVVVPLHGELNRGTLRAIVRQTGLPWRSSLTCCDLRSTRLAAILSRRLEITVSPLPGPSSAAEPEAHVGLQAVQRPGYPPLRHEWTELRVAKPAFAGWNLALAHEGGLCHA